MSSQAVTYTLHQVLKSTAKGSSYECYLYKQRDANVYVLSGISPYVSTLRVPLESRKLRKTRFTREDIGLVRGNATVVTLSQDGRYVFDGIECVVV